MPEKGKWPFDSGDQTTSGHDWDRVAQKEQSMLAAESLRRQHLRHDRLIVGGKAHTKKQGLS